MSVVQVGDGYPLRYRSVNSDRELVAATITLSVTDPSGNITSPTVSNPSLGIYEAVIDVDEAGFWSYRWTVTDPYDDIDDGRFTAAAAVASDYVSLALFKANLKTTATSHEELMQLAISTASRKVDEHCWRPHGFWRDTSATVREYSRSRIIAVGQPAYPSEQILVDDIASTSGLIVQVGSGASWTTISSSEYDFAPDNALADYRPIEGITRRGAAWTTSSDQRIRVTALHGWPTVPQLVVQATLIQATRYYLRKDSPEGVTGTAEWGLIRMSRIDPDVQELLKDFVKFGGVLCA